MSKLVRTPPKNEGPLRMFLAASLLKFSKLKLELKLEQGRAWSFLIACLRYLNNYSEYCWCTCIGDTQKSLWHISLLIPVLLGTFFNMDWRQTNIFSCIGSSMNHEFTDRQTDSQTLSSVCLWWPPHGICWQQIGGKWHLMSFNDR